MSSTSEAKHTPGPWHYFTHFDNAGHALVHADGRQCMKYLCGSNGQGFARTVGLDEPQDSANARLIAAAPDLLEACKEAQTQLRYMRDVMESIGSFYPNADGECESRLNVIDSAIAKAEGK